MSETAIKNPQVNVDESEVEEEKPVQANTGPVTVTTGGQTFTLEIKETKTNEEDEDPIFTKRAKLYRFAAEANEWKERGKGEAKLLKHKTTGKVRFLMRRDKTFKICGNHYIIDSMKLEPHAGSDRAFVYTCPADFADEEQKSEVFCIRFGNAESTSQTDQTIFSGFAPF
mmetsp:Transcript_22020/g.24606  ORF Transcript_22020/g.24606 Transcript_22020/m.24606 type:complete len:170 (-) Transcript_22020:141-650(-)